MEELVRFLSQGYVIKFIIEAVSVIAVCIFTFYFIAEIIFTYIRKAELKKEK